MVHAVTCGRITPPKQLETRNSCTHTLNRLEHHGSRSQTRHRYPRTCTRGPAAHRPGALLTGLRRQTVRGSKESRSRQKSLMGRLRGSWLPSPHQRGEASGLNNTGYPPTSLESRHKAATTHARVRSMQQSGYNAVQGLSLLRTHRRFGAKDTACLVDQKGVIQTRTSFLDHRYGTVHGGGGKVTLRLVCRLSWWRW